jgi:hypothetical protein
LPDHDLSFLSDNRIARFVGTGADGAATVRTTPLPLRRWDAPLTDVGGFGAGSELTWQALGTVTYRATDWLDLRAGYRHLGVERSRNRTDIDVGLSGPIVGALYRF